MASIGRASAAEFFGTFLFFMIGIGSILHSGDLLVVALGHGLALAIMITVFGGISGGHFNPAVSIGVAATGRMGWDRAGAYILAQIAGGALAGFVNLSIFPTGPGEGIPALGDGVSVATAIGVEALLTFFLLIAIWGTGVEPRGVNVGGFAIGLAVTVDILMGGQLTGAAMNPARHFGPAIALGGWEHWWVYWVGPILGSLVASFVWVSLFSTRNEAPATAAGATTP